MQAHGHSRYPANDSDAESDYCVYVWNVLRAHTAFSHWVFGPICRPIRQDLGKLAQCPIVYRHAYVAIYTNGASKDQRCSEHNWAGSMSKKC